MWRCARRSLPGTARVQHAPIDGQRLCQISRRHGSSKTWVKPSPGRAILSGIQPTGIPHLGNYFGALQQWVKLQNERQEGDELLFPIVDLHALTVPQDRSRFRQQRHEAYIALRAVGLDPKQSHIFFQSEVPAHVELMWILSTVASTGYLSRMTQWKTKLALSEDETLHSDTATAKLKLGLFSYPVLQAADILLYKATHVPVGEDQQQHIEFTRTLAGSFNSVYGDVFVPPEAMISSARRIMSLTDPRKKMSKSDPNANSSVLITDNEKTIHAKFRAALTDSLDGITYDPETRPGIANLINILRAARGQSETTTGAEVAAEFADSSLKTLKEGVADSVNLSLKDVRERFEHYRHQDAENAEAQNHSRIAAASKANRTMGKVYRKLGLDRAKT